MTFSALPDWPFFLTGAVLAIAGLVLAWRAFFRDRSRGVPRCPKCWYDLRGAPANRCSECGEPIRMPLVPGL